MILNVKHKTYQIKEVSQNFEVIILIVFFHFIDLKRITKNELLQKQLSVCFWSVNLKVKTLIADHHWLFTSVEFKWLFHFKMFSRIISWTPTYLTKGVYAFSLFISFLLERVSQMFFQICHLTLKKNLKKIIYFYDYYCFIFLRNIGKRVLRIELKF